ncbi:hypothetical protein CRENBAI_005732 [Crenichthys baileyi]|uniref:Uncharacterized protein n=1 Tax=Crenichthys baileyi TaxID=28760 RepID=A0AAV9R2G6_9TELE
MSTPKENLKLAQDLEVEAACPRAPPEALQAGALDLAKGCSAAAGSSFPPLGTWPWAAPWSSSSSSPGVPGVGCSAAAVAAPWSPVWKGGNGKHRGVKTAWAGACSKPGKLCCGRRRCGLCLCSEPRETVGFRQKEDAGLLAAVLTSEGRETPPLRQRPAVNPCHVRAIPCGGRKDDGLAAGTEGGIGEHRKLRPGDRAALPNSLALGCPHAPSVFQQQWRGQHLQVGGQIFLIASSFESSTQRFPKASAFRLSAGSVIDGKSFCHDLRETGPPNAD